MQILKSLTLFINVFVFIFLRGFHVNIPNSTYFLIIKRKTLNNFEYFCIFVGYIIKKRLKQIKNRKSNNKTSLNQQLSGI